MKKAVMRRPSEPVGELLHYRECGLANVWLANGWKIQETPFGRALSISAVDELFAALALHIARQPGRPSAEELRFLRQHLDLTQGQLGELLGLSDQQVARWEKGQSIISVAALHVLRLLVLERLGAPVAVEANLKSALGRGQRQPGRVVARRGAKWRTEIAA